jgi:hypothetical protein
MQGNPIKKVMLLAGCLAMSSIGAADWIHARCDIYPKGQDQASAVIPCVFSQTQGHIVITRSDGIVHDLLPQGENPGLYKDAEGNPVYRKQGLGEDGQIFLLEKEVVYVYWDTAGLPGNDNSDNYTAPYSTEQFDATTRVPCSMDGAVAMKGPDCAAGVNRGPKPGQAVIVIMRGDGVERILRFEGGKVTSPEAGRIKASLEGDEWFIAIDGNESYRIPQAFLEGG